MISYVDSFYSEASFPYCTLPYPKNEALPLDIDNDGTNDLMFYGSNSVSFVPQGGPSCFCSNEIRYILGMNTINSSDSIAVLTHAYPNLKPVNFLSYNASIDSTLKYLNYAHMYDENPYFPLTYSPNQIMYFGLKLLRNGKRMFAWLEVRRINHSLMVYEFAYNKAKGRPIRAGQK